MHQPSEIGELPPSAPLESSPRRGQGDGAASSELQTKYEDVLAENEALRMGMYEILEKLREYDGGLPIQSQGIIFLIVNLL